MKLYDMDKDEWRGTFSRRGERWHSTRDYSCIVCCRPSNGWVMAGAPGIGPRPMCDQCYEQTMVEGWLWHVRHFGPDGAKRMYPRKYPDFWKEKQDYLEKLVARQAEVLPF